MTHQILAESIISDSNSPTVLQATEEVIRLSAQKLLFPESENNETETGLPKLIRSKNDKFDYRLIELENKIQVLLVSDLLDLKLLDDSKEDEFKDKDDDENETGSTRKSAAIVIALKVGSLQAPKDQPELAHYLEHLILLGSEKFPADGALDQFLASHGGGVDACTQSQYTLYKVNVNRSYLKQALEMLTDAIQSPLLSQESLEQEIKIIQAETLEKASDEEYCIAALLSHLSKTDSNQNQESKCEIGELRQSLVEFHQNWYKPENMIVVLQAPESVENLEKLSIEIFSDFKSPKSQDLVEDSSSLAELPDLQFHQFLLVESVDPGSRFLIHWFFPSTENDYLVSASSYLSRLIRQEGKGGLISQLRSRDLAHDLYTNESSSTVFTIEIQLTQSGVLKLGEIVSLLFEYLFMIRKLGTQEYFYRENAQIALNSFNLECQQLSMIYATNLAENLITYPVEYLLTGSDLYYYYDKTKIEELLELFQPETACFMHIGGEFVPDVPVNVETKVKVKFQKLPVPSEWLTKDFLESDYFSYPPPNRFIPENFTLVLKDLPQDAIERQLLPIQLENGERFRVWHMTDLVYHQPKGLIDVYLMSPELNGDSVMNAVHRDLLFSYLMLIFKDEFNNARIAGLVWDIHLTQHGLLIMAFGFSDKLDQLIQNLLERLSSFTVDSKQFEMVKSDLIRQYASEYQETDAIADDILHSALLERYFALERSGKVEEVSGESLEKCRNQVLSNLSIDLLVYGNFTIESTRKISSQIRETFHLDTLSGIPFQRQKRQVYQIPSGITRMRTLAQTSQCLINYVGIYQQLGPRNLQSICYLDLFIDVIADLCWKVLRCESGLGYRIGCPGKEIEGIEGFIIYVTSNADEFDCSYIEKQILDFLNVSCSEFINELTEEQFGEFLESQLENWQEKNVNLSHESHRLGDEIQSFDFAFDRNQKIVAQLQNSTLDHFKEWVFNEILTPLDSRKLLSIQIVGNGAKSLEECLTSEDLPVDESIMARKCEDSSTEHRFQLLKSTNSSLNRFQVDIKDFQQTMTLYPVQPSLCDLI